MIAITYAVMPSTYDRIDIAVVEVQTPGLGLLIISFPSPSSSSSHTAQSQALGFGLCIFLAESAYILNAIAHPLGLDRV